MIHPGGTSSPLLLATNNLPSATIDVVTSSMTVPPPFEIFADAYDAVRVVADEIRIDQAPRHRGRLLRGATGALHDRGHDLHQLGRGNSPHCCCVWRFRTISLAGPFPLDGGRTD